MNGQKKARHDAKMAAVRKAGQEPPTERATVPGGFARFLPTRRQEQPVRIADLVPAMENYRWHRAPTLARELGLEDPLTGVLDAKRVKALRVEDVARSDAVRSLVRDDLADLLRDRLDYRVGKGWLSLEARDAELRRFHEETAPHADAVFARILVDHLRREAGR